MLVAQLVTSFKHQHAKRRGKGRKAQNEGQVIDFLPAETEI
jgi:hypothetical protein